MELESSPHMPCMQHALPPSCVTETYVVTCSGRGRQGDLARKGVLCAPVHGEHCHHRPRQTQVLAQSQHTPQPLHAGHNA
jgi:hypothetical protein